jgi:dTDP-4-amino-4,6-dideoxygalactose transaminase
MIPFNKPHLTGKEMHYMYQAVIAGKISGNGDYTKKCQAKFERKYGFRKSLLTTSCTDALEMCALLIDVQPGDEIIMPSYTFVSTAIAFVRQGAKIVFADSRPDHPGLDEEKVMPLLSKKTKAIVPVHYAGVACDMDKIFDIAKSNHLYVIEDSAQAIDSYYRGRALGSIGDLSAFSFHETKNINSGEGGLLAVNNETFVKRSEIIWEKGTNRSEFFRGEVNKYGWVDIGSSFLPSELNAAYLYAQLENLKPIQKRRIDIWNLYYNELRESEEKGFIRLPSIPDYATNNAHMFYILCRTKNERDGLITFLKSRDIKAVFHYLSLHKSDYYAKYHDQRELPYSDYYMDCLVRLPMYYDLRDEDVHLISNAIRNYYKSIN